jgi:plastocyanin
MRTNDVSIPQSWGLMFAFTATLFWTASWPGVEPATESEAGDRPKKEAHHIIHGRIQLVAEDGEVVEDRREFARTVAYFEPDDNSEFDLIEAQAELTTTRRQFSPRVLLVQAGTEVQFPNDDPILHNVFSSSSGNQFDLGHYGQGPGKSHRFVTPGLVRVFCNVHPAMSAHIVVVNSPHFVQPDRNGVFRLEDIPPMPGQLTIWHERSEPQRFRIDPEQIRTDLGTIELALTVRELRPQRERLRQRRRGRY